MTTKEKTITTQRKQRLNSRTIKATQDCLPKAPTLDNIIDAILEQFGISKEVFFQNKSYRGRDFVLIRQWISFLAFRYHYRTQEVGEALHRDHSSVTYGAKAISEMLDVYPAARLLKTAIMQRIKRNIITDLELHSHNLNETHPEISVFYHPRHRFLISSSTGMDYKPYLMEKIPSL